MPNADPPRSTPREATARASTTAAGRATPRIRATGPSGRAPNHGHTASSAKDNVATAVCATEDSVREGSGSAATPRVATPPAASRTRPTRRAGTRAQAVTRWARPVMTRPVVMIHRCGVADAASALIDSALASKPPGWAAAAQVHPPTRASTATVALSTAVRGRPTGPADVVGGSLVGSGMRTTLGRDPASPAPVCRHRQRCRGPVDPCSRPPSRPRMMPGVASTPTQVEQPGVDSMSKPSFAARTFVSAFTRVNRRTPWHRLPWLAGMFNLMALRIQLRADNLTDTRTPDPTLRRAGRDARPVPRARVPVPHARRLVQRPGRPRHGHGRHPVRPQRRRSTRRTPSRCPG